MSRPTGPIYVEDVWRRYGRGRDAYDAVRGVSFVVQPGELFALLGTNGAGKTSTIELVEGLAAPHRGRIRVFGELDPVRDRQLIRPRTGVMLQTGGFVPHLTVAETVQMWADLSTDPRSVSDALDRTNLSHRADVQVRNLSGGERRRLDLAASTLTRPDVLFLDEPTTGMDAEGRRATWDLISDLRTAGTTIILTTHYLEEAEVLADHLAIMHRGVVATAGTVEQVVADYPATLSFSLPAGRSSGDLPPLLGETVTDGAATVVTTADLQADATVVLAWADRNRVTLGGFTARPASLEEAFISIAGRVEDDAEPDPGRLGARPVEAGVDTLGVGGAR